MNSNDLAPVLIAGAGALTIGGTLARGETPKVSTFIGTAGAGLFVLAMTAVNPKLGTGFALVVFLTALLTSGYDLAGGVSRALNR